MSEFTLQAVSPLDGYSRAFTDVTLREETGMALVSLALPLGGEEAAEQAIAGAFGTDLPPVGQSVVATGGERLIRTGQDQAMVLLAHASPDAEPVIRAGLSGAVYTTDQTDAWVMLAIEGPAARRALERICPLDLHPDAFGPDAAARTIMEHLGTLIIRTGAEAFLLLSASSSAGSFLHAVELSVQNTS